MEDYSEYSFVIDVDGTLCPIKKENEKYEDLIPYKNIVDRLVFYHDRGAKITLFSSRNMRTYEGNLGLINKNTGLTMMKWLEKWNIPYDEILFGKPWPGKKGFYVDDRTVRPDEFLNCEVEELNEICKKSRGDSI